MVKSILLFCGMRYYPNGGMGDYEGSFSTLSDARRWFMEKNRGERYDWAHVFDTATNEVIELKKCTYGKTSDNWDNGLVVKSDKDIPIKLS